jgi:hypothetical protein
MGTKEAPTPKGRQAAKGLREAAAQEERKTEARKGSELEKGAKRFEERSRSSDGKSAATKQH